jgi:hypothetical protein
MTECHNSSSADAGEHQQIDVADEPPKNDKVDDKRT